MHAASLPALGVAVIPHAPDPGATTSLGTTAVVAGKEHSPTDGYSVIESATQVEEEEMGERGYWHELLPLAGHNNGASVASSTDCSK